MNTSSTCFMEGCFSASFRRVELRRCGSYYHTTFSTRIFLIFVRNSRLQSLLFFFEITEFAGFFSRTPTYNIGVQVHAMCMTITKCNRVLETDHPLFMPCCVFLVPIVTVLKVGRADLLLSCRGIREISQETEQARYTVRRSLGRESLLIFIG